MLNNCTASRVLSVVYATEKKQKKYRLLTHPKDDDIALARFKSFSQCGQRTVTTPGSVQQAPAFPAIPTEATGPSTRTRA
jgi:hypothetical protein